jgi:formamidopyrimidine-DNA glycosylase
MPELPEVTTTVNDLQKVLPGLSIRDVWTDLSKKNQTIKQFKNTIKDEKFFRKFRKEITGKKIIKVERRAKNILINISGENTILIHLKMTGHLLYGKYIYNKEEDNWVPDKNEKVSFFDSYNRFIHVVFYLSNGKYLAMSDARKFGKVTMIPTKMLDDARYTLHDLGPEPLEKKFTFPKFKERLLAKPNKNIKTTLMDQSVIAGIGNIYSDEMLWLAGIHPESKPGKIDGKVLLKLYESMKKVLNKGIDFGGDSMSDYRNIHGERGNFQEHHNVYRMNKQKCGKVECKGVIMRKVINGRSAHFCNKHQKLFS